MNRQSRKNVSRKQESGKGSTILLILFILLVIATSVFCKSAAANKRIYRQEEYQQFDIINNTTNFTLILIDLTPGTELPTVIFIPPGGGVASYQLPNIPNGVTSATVKYALVSDETLENVGVLDATLENSRAYFHWFKDISTTAPIATRAYYGPSPEYVAKMAVSDI